MSDAWIQTFTGGQCFPLDPKPEQIRIEDIAHALSNMCRFAGHTRRFYSVAEHSVRVARCVPPADALAGLLHDATEAYLVDVPRPIKGHLAGYRAIEARLNAVIMARFGLPAELPASVHHADNVVLATEARDLMNRHEGRWEALPDPLPRAIVPWTTRRAEQKFLAAFYRLGGVP